MTRISPDEKVSAEINQIIKRKKNEKYILENNQRSGVGNFYVGDVRSGSGVRADIGRSPTRANQRHRWRVANGDNAA